MSEKITGYLEVGLNDADEIIVNHPDLKPDEHGVGHIVFSADQARHLARLLLKNADESASKIAQRERAEKMRIAESIPVDRSAQVLTDGSSVTPEHREIDPATGMQNAYVVLCAEERAKGFVRPYRDAYRHDQCGKVTTMSRRIAETYARDPGFYSGTFCTHCGAHFPVGETGEFSWYEMDGSIGPKVGT